MFARRRLPVIAGLAAFLVLVGSGSAWSYWTTQASAAGSITTDTVAVAQAGFASPAETKYLPSSLTSTRSFTVANNSTIAGTATVSIATSEAGASSLPITVWRYTSGTCTDATSVPGSGVTTGTWGSTTITLTNLGAGQSATLCVRTSIPDWKTITTTSGGRTVNPVLSVSLNAQGWVATAPTATNIQRTAGMYPLTANFFDATKSSWFTVKSLATGLCLDVAGSGGSGTRAISWNCHQDSNQRWQFLPVSGTVQNLVTIRPRHQPGTRLTYTSTGVQQIATNTSSTAQQWYVQNSGTFYQLVSAVTGMCLGLHTASTDVDMNVVDCDDARAQLTFNREPLTMTWETTGWIFTTTTVTLSFNSTVTTTGMTLQKRTGTNSWSTVTAIDTGDTSVSFNRTQIAESGTTEFRIVFAGTSDVAYGNILLSRSSGNGVAASGGIG